MGRKLNKTEVLEVINLLKERFPDAKAELDYSNPFELLIATILSAQCTDVRVNKITSELFQELESPEDYLKLSQEELGERIRSCGFYNTKSKNILGTCDILVREYGGKVPETIEELMSLPGVGKKTANVVVSNAFGVPAIAVDTHVFRVSNRIGIAKAKNVEETEAQLERAIPKDLWTQSHHLLIFQGRRVCRARKPLCLECNVIEYCQFKDKILDR